ncbi:substrate-binding domain-containing protein [Lachnospiraceae bacterium ZAX-1]
MKKRFLSAFMCVAMVAALVGCGEAKTEEPAVAETPASEVEGPAEEVADDAAEEATDDADTVGRTLDTSPLSGKTIYLVSKGFQHQYWQAVLQGANEAAEEFGVTVDFQGPADESAYAEQLQLLNNAVNNAPPAIGLAALSTESCLEAIQTALDNGIPIVGFDSGVPDAPAGAIVANAATDNYAAGEIAADNTYPLIKEKIVAATAPIRIGVLSQDNTSASVTLRGTGFIDKMRTILESEGKTVSVEGNDFFIGKCGGSTDGADVVIEVLVPAKVDMALSTIDAQNLLNKEETVAIYGSNSHAAEALIAGDENIGRLAKDVVGVGFDSGTVIKTAIKDGRLAGAITQAPVAIGYNTVKLCVEAALGQPVQDVDTGCQWFTADNIDDPEIAQNLYD